MSSNDLENRMHEFDNVPGSNAQATMAAGPSDEIQDMELSSFLHKNKPDNAFTIDTIQSLSHSSSGLSTQTYHSENQFSGQEKEKFPDTNTVDTYTTASLNQSKSSLTCCTFEDITTNAPSTNGDNKLTPKAKTVQSWKQLSISPTNLISVDDAILKRREDEIESMDFYQNGKQAIKRAVLYLYGVGYRSSETKEYRIKGIECLVSKPNLRRLLDFVFEGCLNQRSVRRKTKSFFTMAVVLKRYFSNDADADVNLEKFGYFPGKPFVRYQRGSNENCYEPASSVWASLVIRHQDPNVEDNYVVDVGQRTRRYILYDKKKIDQRIENRVIKNAGGYSREYASLIVDGNKLLEKNLNNQKIWKHGSFESTNGRFFIDCVNECGPGLITNFFLTEKFREAGGSKESDGCGYWMFDGDNVDIKGKWISCEDDLEYKAQLSAIVEKEMSDAEAAHQNLKREMEDLFRSNENCNIPTLTTATNPEDKVNENTSHGGSTEYHAMVLLGGRMISDGAKRKIYFMCQNSWHTMPLVVCSRNYLEACQAKVLFRVRKIGSELKDIYLSSSNLIADCTSPYSGREDVNDNTDPALMFANESSKSTPSWEPPKISNFTFNDCFDSDDNDY